MTLTEVQARKLGYQLTRGAYSGTLDDRIDRWYWDLIESETFNRTGPGFATKEAALEHLTETVEINRGLDAEEEADEQLGRNEQ
jgi:hypothetical protein